MVEREPVVEQERIVYEGLFSFQDILRLIEDWEATKGYVHIEKRSIESVKPEGKYVEYWLAPFKKITDYAKYLVWIRILGSQLKERVIEKDGQRHVLLEGKIQIVMDSFLETDWEHRWESKAVFYFIRTIWDKYVYKPFLSGFRTGVKDDTVQLKNQLKAQLNMYKY